MNKHPSTPPRAVVFDLGKVLLDFDYRIAARTLAAKSRFEAEEFKRVVDQSPLLHRYESAAITTAEFFAEVAQLTGYHGTVAEFRAAFGDIFSEIPAMLALHRELRVRDIPTFIFSNTNEIAVGHIQERFPFFANFTGYVYSHEVGCMKPAPKIYEAIETLTSLTGADLLYLDDRAENIAAGAARGWQTILHHDPAVTVPAVWQKLKTD
jgi:FMN phosphatase YigB (HAD superfamily)